MPNIGADNLLSAVLLTACACFYSFAWSPVPHPMHRASFPTSITSRNNRARQPFRSNPWVAMSSAGLEAPKRVAVLGAGAAGLVAGRLLHDAGFDVHILEKTSTVGGVWKYRPKDVVYKSLTTNLPKEIMAFLDAPFDPTLPSFLGHAQVQEYLENYAEQHALSDLIEFNTEVKAVRPVRRSGSSSSSSNGCDVGEGKKDGYVPWPAGNYTVLKENERDKEEEGEGPLWQVTTASSNHRHHLNQQQQGERQEIYDAVVVCNGHYDVPYTPSLPGLSGNYKGRILHSREYDNPEMFRGLKVLCVGYKSSGTDIAREVASVAKEVHVVDRRLSKAVKEGMKEVEEIGVHLGNIYRRPDVLGFFPGDDGEGKSVGFVDGSVCDGVDVVLFCTGYCYSMPFLSGGTLDEEMNPSSSSSSLPTSDARLLRIKDRAVFPLYQHLFHAYFPSLVFLGLLHSVVPFPMFELQAKWLVRSLLSSAQQEQGRSAGTSSSLPSPPSPSLPSRRARFQWLEEEKHRRKQPLTDNFVSAASGATSTTSTTAAAAAAASSSPTVPPQVVVPEGPAGPPPAAAAAATAATTGLGRDWFYMGPNQWAYNRLLATQAQCLTPELEQDLQIRKGIYDDVSKRRPIFPGGRDSYRKCEYRMEEIKKGWTVMEGEEKEEQPAKNERKAQYL